jgi:hypothetical protein
MRAVPEPQLHPVYDVLDDRGDVDRELAAAG